MTVKEVISAALFKMGYGEVDFDEMTSEESALVQKMLKCLNLVYQQIETEYLPLTKKETKNFSGGTLEISTLSKPLLYVVGIKKDGVAKSFKTKASYIETTFDGDAEIEYAYLADDFLLTGEIEDKRLAKWLIADGVVAEFCYAENMPVEAAAAYKRFTDGLKYLKNKSLRLTVLARRWPQ